LIWFIGKGEKVQGGLDLCTRVKESYKLPNPLLHDMMLNDLHNLRYITTKPFEKINNNNFSLGEN